MADEVVGADAGGRSVPLTSGGRRWGADWLPFVLAPAFALAMFLPVLFDVIREIPPSYDCGELASAGLDEMVASYQKGFEVLHGVTLLLLLAAIATLSVARRRRVRAGGIGRPTAWAFVGIGVAALGALLSSDPPAVAAVAAVLPALALLVGAAPLGPQLTGVIAAAAIGFLGFRAMIASRTDGALYAPSVFCWVLFLLTGGHALVVSEQGHGPYLC